jgi:hypothetical protein
MAPHFRAGRGGIVHVRLRDRPLGVVFQEVVHLVRTEEAEVAKLQCSP